MDHVRVETVTELESALAKYGDDALFRGQTAHYGDPDKPSVATSFDRRGCIPSQMLKWSRYATNVLDVFIRDYDDPQAHNQALLQHYGWRSFYIDCSSNPAVGAWFASHKYSDRFVVEMSEDCEERPIWLRKRMAQYDFEDGDGHLYILDKVVCAQIGLVDLEALDIEDCRPRTSAQAAWLLGPLRRAPMPQPCFRAHITASRAVLRDYAAAHGLSETETLFPSVKEDPILHALLGLPWREIEGVRDKDFPIAAFERALDLPEYQESYVKIAWPRTAFFCGAKIIETLDSIEGDDVGGISVYVPDIVLFGSADKNTPMRFPKVEELVRENGTVAFEIGELFQHANMGHTTLYQKGIGVIPRGEDLFEVCELLVEHPGMDLTRAGLNRGWFYRRNGEGFWQREEHEQQCPCGDAKTHEGHVSALHITEAYLKNSKDFAD
jgi:hypothetical protein